MESYSLLTVYAIQITLQGLLLGAQGKDYSVLFVLFVCLFVYLILYLTTVCLLRAIIQKVFPSRYGSLLSVRPAWETCSNCYSSELGRCRVGSPSDT